MSASTSASTVVGFGTAHLFAGIDAERSRALLQTALAAGLTRLDTAPSYGFGDAESAVALATAKTPTRFVTTKVGLEPAVRPSPARARLGRLVRLLPPAAGAAVRRLPGAPRQQPLLEAGARTGRFEPAAVRASVERSLARLGRIDRLLLHEVSPADVDDDLLRMLTAYRDRGDVGTLGSATAVELTEAVIVAGAGELSVAQYSAGLWTPSPALPDAVHRVGHGLLGPASRDVRRLRSVVASPAGRVWSQTVAGTVFDGRDGLAVALLAAGMRRLPEVVVTSSRTEGILALTRLADGAASWPDDLDGPWAALVAIAGGTVNVR